jgi:hypothetical protein
VVAGLNTYATNLVATNATPLGNYLTKGASTQQVVIAPVQFNGTLRAGGAVALTNGFTRSVTNISPVTSNLVNYGNAIRSEGSGGNSLQVGSNALASGSLSMAIGNNALANSSEAIAIGINAKATNDYATVIGSGASSTATAGTAIGQNSSAAENAVALGREASANASTSVAIGDQSTASGEQSIAIGGADTGATQYGAIAIGVAGSANANQAVAIGYQAQAGHSNSVALGPQDSLGNYVATTTTNQLRLGTANHVVSVPGFIRGTLSNLVTVAGQTNVLAGDLSTPIATLTTMANGANRLNMGTNSVVNITGSPTAAWSISGIIFGTTTPRDGHRLSLRNGTGYDAVLNHNSGLEAVAAYRLSSPTSADTILTNGATAQLVYSASDARWLIWSVWDGRVPGVSASATNSLTSIYTNGVSVSGALLTNLNIIYGSNMVFRATNTSGSVDLHISSAAAGGGGGGSLVTNANQFGADTTLTIKTSPLVTNFIAHGTASLPSLRVDGSASAATNILEVWAGGTNRTVRVASDGNFYLVGGLEAGATVTASGFKSTLQDQERVLGTDSGGNFVELTTPVATLGYIDNVTSDIQTQLNGKLSSATNENQFGASTTLTIKDTPLITNLWVYGNNTNALRVNSGVITSSLPALDISQTWSNNGVAFSGNRTVITDLGSGEESALLEGIYLTNSVRYTNFTFTKFGDLKLRKTVSGKAPRISFENHNSSSANTIYNEFEVLNLSTVNGVNVSGSSSARLVFNSDTALWRDSAYVFQLGSDAASPISHTLKAHDGSGTDKAGASLSINGGQSTGTGVGGALIKNTSLTGTTGSSANSYSVREYIYAGETTLTEGAATGFVTIALPASKYAGVHVFLTTHADDATDFQATTDMFSVSAVAKGTNISSNVATPTQSTIGSTGTLTTAITVTSTTNNTFTLNCNATSSLTQTTLKAKWQIRINSDAAATVTPL